MPRTIGNDDGDVSPFSAPSCLGHRVHFEGGKPPLPTVPSIRNADPLACVEGKVPCHHTVRQGGGAEEKVVSGGGIEGDLKEVLSGL